MVNNKKSKIKYKSVLIFCVMVIIIVIIVLLLFKNNGNNKKLGGNKIIDGLYAYELKEKNSIPSIQINDEGIYYLTNDNDIYKLSKFDMYTNETTVIGTINSEMCRLNDYYLSCVNKDERTIYDVNMNEIYKSNDIFDAVPYQDTFLIIKEKNIYLNNEKFRTIKESIPRFDIVNYYVNDDNTFIAFISMDDTYIYNVKDDSYDKFICNNIYHYENGMYYGTKDKLIIKNLDNNINKDYNYITSDENIELSTIRDNWYYYMDYKYLKIYNLETNKINFLDYKFDKAIDKLVLKDNYIYLIYQGENPQIYIVKIDEIDSNEYTISEYKNVQTNKIKDKIKEIENKYDDVKIIYDIKDINDYSSFNIKLVNEDKFELIDEALNAIDSLFNKFGKDFIKLFKYDDYKGLRIIISKEIITSEDAGVKDLVGQFFPNNDYYNIILARGTLLYEKSFCHEMMHAIDHNALEKKYEISGKWYDYNPKDFEYGIKNYQDGNLIYTTYANDEKDVYFIDPYSKLNQDEDRARIFENICYVDGENVIVKYSNLMKKAVYLRDELLKYYPSLNNSKVFDSMK